MEMRTMYLQDVNEYDETIEREYLIPVKAIGHYLETDDMDEIQRFLDSEYISDDTANIIEDCKELNFHYELMHEEITDIKYSVNGGALMDLNELELLGQKLQDDESERGGISHADERLAEVVEELLQENVNGLRDAINSHLADIGIKPITIEEEEF